MKKFQALSCLLALLALPSVTACAAHKHSGAAPPADEPALVAPMPPEEQTTLPEEQGEEEILQNEVQYLCTTASALNVRSGAGTAYSPLGTVEKNVLLKCGQRQGDWYETAYRGRRAFVCASYVVPVALNRASEKTERVIDEGLMLLGTPYVYGATRYHDGRGNLLKGFTAEQFDCSSLMQYIFYRGAGVLLNVTTRTQVTQGEAVAREQLQRGDLMFFTNASRKNKTGIERIGHVALYLGDGYVLHTASDYAKIEKLSPARLNYYICARRVISD